MKTKLDQTSNIRTPLLWKTPCLQAGAFVFVELSCTLLLQVRYIYTSSALKDATFFHILYFILILIQQTKVADIWIWMQPIPLDQFLLFLATTTHHHLSYLLTIFLFPTLKKSTIKDK